MNRWKQAAIAYALVAAISNSSPVLASLNRGMLNTETAAIRVAKSFPLDMSTNISLDTPLTVEFGGAVNQSFYKSVNLNLFQGTTPIAGELFYNPSARQIMFKAKQALKEGQTYTAQLSYFDGLGRTSEKVWSFQTSGNSPQLQSMPQNTPVSLSQKSPEPTPNTNHLHISNANMGSGSVKPGTVLQVTFSEALDITTLKSAPVKLLADNIPIGVDYKLSRDLKTITVSPRKPLNGNINYAVAVNTSLSGSSGATLRKKTLIPFKINQTNPIDNIKVSDNEIAEAPAAAINNKFENPFGNTRQTQQAVRKATPQQRQAVQPVRPTAPLAQVIGLAPQNGSRVTNITQPITIAFNEEIRPETLNEFTFRLEDDFGPVPAKIHYFKGSKQATLTPIGTLDANKTYRVMVTQGITDLANRPIKTGISSRFMVSSPIAEPAMPKNAFVAKPAAKRMPAKSSVQEAAELENFNARPMRYEQRTPAVANANNYNQASRQTTAKGVVQNRSQQQVQQRPQQQVQPQQKLNSFKVTSIYPGARANKVSRRSKIAVHFSEPADAKTVNNINISVFGKQRRVEGKIIYDRKKNRAIFEPSSPLEADTNYKVLVSSKVKSKLGETLGNGFSWQFATSKGLRHNYNPKRRTAEADAAFYIPLVDGRIKHTPKTTTKASKSLFSGRGSGSFNFINPKHWAFKSVRHIANNGLIDNYPFSSKNSVTRYEFASTINLALNNLKSMQNSPIKPKLRVADLVKLEELIMEFRRELKSYGVNSRWFETFLSQQGVDLRKIQAHVSKLNG